MLTRLTNKILLSLVVLYFKTFWHVGAYGTESGRDERFHKQPILEQGKLLLKVLFFLKVSGC